VKLDVVIVTHQSADHIERAIGRLGAVAQIVTIDNASTDRSDELAAHAGSDVVKNDSNAGFAAAANQGAALGSADAILFLNPDASIEPENLQSLTAALDANPKLAIVAPRLRYDDGTQQRVRWPFPASADAWREAVGLHRVFTHELKEGFVVGACFLVRRAVFEQLGGFDTRYWLYGEETDLCRRALDLGWQIRVIDEATANHIGGASTHAASELVAEHFERGGERFVADHEGVGGLVSYRLANLLGAAFRTCTPGSSARRSLHRDRLRRYLRVLMSHPTTVALDSPAGAAAAHTVVVCSLEAWDDVWRRNQFLVRELLTLDPQLRVLFVEPAFDWLHRLRHRAGPPRRRGLRPVRPDARVLAFQPGKVVPRLLGPIADRSLQRQVLGAARRMGFTNPVLWINDASYAGLPSESGWPSLYDITDDWPRASVPPRVRRRLAVNERMLFKTAGQVVVCSQDLASSRRRQRPDLNVIPNAVDVEHFKSPQPRPADLPPAPVAVYVGTLHEDRLNVALVQQLAAEIPELQIALVGPSSLCASSTKRLDSMPNVHFLGARPYASVPGYLQHSDVLIVPHVVTPFTESLDPIKAYECQAVARPTVATPVAGFRDLGDPIHVAPSERFAAEVRAVLAEPCDRQSGEVASWAERARTFHAALSQARSEREEVA
jgi:teichuronic acid biosynthesis glycosyltransferase TuaH